MASARKKTDVELRRLKMALRENERLMEEAAINYENLIATKETIRAAIDARKESQSKKKPSSPKLSSPSPRQAANQAGRD